MRVLVVAAHADDEVLGPGGTILRHVQAGDEVSVLIACLGKHLSYDTDQTVSLHAAATEVGELLSVRLAIGRLPDQGLDLISLPDVVEVVDREIRAADAELVYTHHWGDINRDHRILGEPPGRRTGGWRPRWLRDAVLDGVGRGGRPTAVRTQHVRRRQRHPGRQDPRVLPLPQ